MFFFRTNVFFVLFVIVIENVSYAFFLEPQPLKCLAQMKLLVYQKTIHIRILDGYERKKQFTIMRYCILIKYTMSIRFPIQIVTRIILAYGFRLDYIIYIRFASINVTRPKPVKLLNTKHRLLKRQKKIPFTSTLRISV